MYTNSDGKGIEFTESTTIDGKKEDNLIIHRKEINFNNVRVKYAIFQLDLMINENSKPVSGFHIDTDTDFLAELIEKELSQNEPIKNQCGIFSSFCKQKTQITINIDKLKEIEKFHRLIVQDDHLFDPMLFHLLPNLKEIKIELASKDRCKSYEISLIKLLLLLDSTSYSNSIIITAKSNSWISDWWNEYAAAIKEEYNLKQWNISFSLVHVDVGKYETWCDQLYISKNIW
eukprot:533031_1